MKIINMFHVLTGSFIASICWLGSLLLYVEIFGVNDMAIVVGVTGLFVGVHLGLNHIGKMTKWY